jgi:broad specificity phosphatase PhoE
MFDHSERSILLIRHGESQVTVNRTIGGFRTCTGLSELGRAQADRLRHRLVTSGEVRNARLVTTQFPRAQETASIISAAFDDPNPAIDEGFGEHDPGPQCDGMSFDDFTARFGEGPDWDDLHGEIFPGGETRAAFQLRVGQALHAVFESQQAPKLVIACHAGVVGAVFRELLGLPPAGGFSLEVRNTSLTELRLIGPRRWQLVRFNDAAHLDGLPTATERAASGS